jgi:hypothetical protein
VEVEGKATEVSVICEVRFAQMSTLGFDGLLGWAEGRLLPDELVFVGSF